MPIYEYSCKKCGKTFEYMQRMSEGPKRKCEACGALALERLISQTSFQLKGAGWYKDLYSSPKPSGGDGAAKAGGDGGGGSGGSGSDGGGSSASGGSSDKPAAAAPAKPAGGDKKAGGGKAKKGTA